MKKSYLEVDVLIISSVVTSTFTPMNFFISLYILYIYLSFAPQFAIPQSAKVVSIWCYLGNASVVTR